MKLLGSTLLVLLCLTSYSQDYRWQQRAEYTMNVALDTKTHIVTGDQELVYFNNSNDTLNKVYYHLFFNAFQPGSMMDVRHQNISDPDKRVGSRISKLQQNEIGYQKVNSLKQDGKTVVTKVNGTILEVQLAKPIMPRSKTTFNMTFEAQVPLQIRRSGRDNIEGISYSMTQWYPKMAEYDFQGWHAYQYVAREFHGIWGDFDVTIAIDSSFVVAGTGILQDPDKIGHGYGKAGSKPVRKDKNLKWHFVAKNVIDFAWAADPDFTHDKVKVPNGPDVHFFYQKNEKTTSTWHALQPIIVETFRFMNDTYGKYPYETYSVIQGGDGGMEYPMCTLILGEGKLEGLVSTAVHEVAHSWYQAVLASNEALHAWMDEGFADFAFDEVIASITHTENKHAGAYKSYFTRMSRGLFEVPNQHSDHFETDRGYKVGSYTTGEVFLHQLRYIVGEKNFDKGMKRYYNTWKFRHPEPNDFLRVLEKTSGMQLHWYYRYFINTNKKIDYEIKEVNDNGDRTEVVLGRVGLIPMPIDLVVTFKDGTKELLYIPLNETMGNKPVGNASMKTEILPDWAWVNPVYKATIQRSITEVASIEIDPSQAMADVDRTNNQWSETQKTPEDGN
ncbi:MAG TPA: M1 family metallopeptidase [Cyclobacteriaceae bacterium]|nr:M1 family metallopeptidase [Cyclobacteriaceae bacterium]